MILIHLERSDWLAFSPSNNHLYGEKRKKKNKYSDSTNTFTLICRKQLQESFASALSTLRNRNQKALILIKIRNYYLLKRILWV